MITVEFVVANCCDSPQVQVRSRTLRMAAYVTNGVTNRDGYKV